MKIFDQIRSFIESLGTKKQPKPALSETPRHATSRPGSNIRVTIQTIEIPLDGKLSKDEARGKESGEEKVKEIPLEEIRTALQDFSDGDVRDLLQ